MEFFRCPRVREMFVERWEFGKFSGWLGGRGCWRGEEDRERRSCRGVVDRTL